MDWWIWVLVGLVCLAVEVVIPGGVILLFFGAAALVLGVLVGLGVGGPLWFQLLLFSSLSVISLLTLRGPILRRLNPGSLTPDTIDAISGEVAILLEDLPAGGVGKAELRGAVWRVRGPAGRALAKGERCTVERVQGLDLWVRPE